MAMSDSALSALILKGMQSEIKKQFPDAKPQKDQKLIANAIAKGIVKTMKTAAKGTGAGIAPAVGPGSGILGLSAPGMTTKAVAYMKAQTGFKGAAIKLMFDGVFKGIVQHLQSNTTVTSPFGGPMTAISGVTPKVCGSFIFKEMPSSYKSSKAGRIFCDAIGTGFAAEISKGKSTIPGAGIPAGAIVAIFS